MNKFARIVPVARRSLVAVPLLAVGSAFAQSADPGAAAVTALTGLVGGQSAYAAPLFALAIATVGIMIGLKWIKRGNRAA